MAIDLEKQALDYHSTPQPGKTALAMTKPCSTQKELSLAYTPGVAAPCLAIKENPENVWKYTAKSNTVAVVSDGTAVLGLGNIGPEAGMPVMEGKAVLFKTFADIDTIPICLTKVFNENGTTNAGKIIETVERLEASFGGINLEDIAAPACFEIENHLSESMSIPVFHDDQHGTAIISLAGVLNALKLVGKKIQNAKFVINGAGAAGIACAEFYITAGAKRENFFMCDSHGVLWQGRNDLTPEKMNFACKHDAGTLGDVVKNADILIGVSAADCFTKNMIESMADKPIIFAMANPKPEIMPEIALNAGAAIVGTGRSDFHNQVNNVLGFPGIFRGALDTRASVINEAMKLAASEALAEIVSEKVDNTVMTILKNAYPEDVAEGMFDGDNPLKTTYVIPKPFDPRVVPRVARKVAQAAIKTGVAGKKIEDFDLYEKQVAARIKNSAKQ